MARVVVGGRVVPERRLAEAVALAGGARELKGGVHDVGLKAEALMQARHEKGVPRRERGHGQHAHDERAVGAVEEARVEERLVALWETHALPH